MRVASGRKERERGERGPSARAFHFRQQRDRQNTAERSTLANFKTTRRENFSSPCTHFVHSRQWKQSSSLATLVQINRATSPQQTYASLSTSPVSSTSPSLLLVRSPADPVHLAASANDRSSTLTQLYAMLPPTPASSRTATDLKASTTFLSLSSPASSFPGAPGSTSNDATDKPTPVDLYVVSYFFLVPLSPPSRRAVANSPLHAGPTNRIRSQDGQTLVPTRRTSLLLGHKGGELSWVMPRCVA